MPGLSVDTVFQSSSMHRARWWEAGTSGKITCTLCPRFCKLGEGQHGFCFIRFNKGGVLYSLGYGNPTGFAVDPIEKKPLYHFFPGSEILSFGTVGCNLGCKFCQNWHISKSDSISDQHVSPEAVIAAAKNNNIPSIAFTYNEPIIFGEYVIDIAEAAKEAGIHTVMVTAGYVEKNARKEIFKNISAANVDLKSMSETFYQKQTLSHLQDVLETILWLHTETDIWVELTTLLIPGENDSSKEVQGLIDWVLKNLGDEVPLHFSAFYPAFKMRDKAATPPETVIAAQARAIASGIKYCYTGNIRSNEGSTTICPNCGVALIKRSGYATRLLTKAGGTCYACRLPIAGRFSNLSESAQR